MNSIRQVILVVVLTLIGIHGIAAGQGGVRVEEKPLTLTTYLVGAPDPDPIFYTGRAYQGAQGKVYPYPMLDNLTDKKVEKPWNAVFLENDYIRICVLPEIGGKLWYALDKTDDYHFIYYNEQVKPALIGMLGAWTSGGIEWNIPHHHRASTFMPVDYTVREHSDGSKTVWIGEIERRHRTRWAVGYTLYPDRSSVEVTIRLYNRTPLEQSFLIFANAAVHANEDYQIIFPPETQYGTFHSKTSFTEWPISHQVYAGRDYTSGVDVSWWKNHPEPTSIFDWGHGNFVAGYDHGQHAGTIIVGNPHIMVGRKFWEWGPGSSGSMWDRNLTDTSGPYVELMAGEYSNNQPDYSWNNPFMVKTATLHFFPLRNMPGVKKANANAALNLEKNSSGGVRVAVNVTGEYPDARVLLLDGNTTILEEHTFLDPGHPFSRDVALPSGTDLYDLELLVVTGRGEKLITYRPVRNAKQPMPETVKPPRAPEEIETVEGLYRAGLRLEQFYNPSRDPLAYYREALHRDPDNSAVNTQMGLYYLKQGNYPVAEQHLRTAVATVTRKYTAPKDAESLYYLGVALLKQNQLDEAYNWLYKSTWDYAWHSPGYYLLATIDCRRADWEQALDHLDKSLSTNTMNIRALAMKSAVLRRLIRPAEAIALTESIVKDTDPLSFLALNEQYLALREAGQTTEAEATLKQLTTLMRNEVESYLELATDYGNAGLYEEALEILERAAHSENDRVRDYPMVHYYLGYYYQQSGREKQAVEQYRQAGGLPSDYCFPYRFESADVLTAALGKNPKGAKAHYYLGNLYYDNQPEPALKEWKQSAELDEDFAPVHRNLAFAYAHLEQDYRKAGTEMEHAIRLSPDDPRYFAEIDGYYEQAGVSPEKRLALLQQHHRVVQQRDDALAAEIRLLILKGDYDRAIALLQNHHFRKIEGVGNIHNQWVDAFLLRGESRLSRKQYDQALSDFRQALEYPEHLEVGSDNREGEVYYFLIGLGYLGQGNQRQARQAFREAVTLNPAHLGATVHLRNQ